MFDGYTLEALFLDVEEAGLHRADVDRDLAVCGKYSGQVTGIYTGKWFFDQQGWSGETWWSAHPLWVSIFNSVADVDVGFKPFHGWTQCQMKQFQGTSSIGEVSQIDLNVMR